MENLAIFIDSSTRERLSYTGWGYSMTYCSIMGVGSPAPIHPGQHKNKGNRNYDHKKSLHIFYPPLIIHNFILSFSEAAVCHFIRSDGRILSLSISFSSVSDARRRFSLVSWISIAVNRACFPISSIRLSGFSSGFCKVHGIHITLIPAMALSGLDKCHSCFLQET